MGLGREGVRLVKKGGWGRLRRCRVGDLLRRFHWGEGGGFLKRLEGLLGMSACSRRWNGKA